MYNQIGDNSQNTETFSENDVTTLECTVKAFVLEDGQGKFPTPFEDQIIFNSLATYLPKIYASTYFEN